MGDMRPIPVTMSLKAWAVLSPIAEPRLAATSISPDISSADAATPRSMARLAASIKSPSAIVPCDAFFMAASISSPLWP